MQIFELIESERKKSESLLRRIEDSTQGQADERRRMVRELAQRLATVEQVEQEHLYPVLVGHDHTRADVERSRAQWSSVREALAALEASDPGASDFQRQVELLRGRAESLSAHEQRTLFPHARDVMPGEEAGRLGTIAESRHLGP